METFVDSYVDFNENSSLGNYIQWVRNVRAESADDGELISELMAGQTLVAISIKLKPCEGINILDIAYIDITDDSLCKAELVITPDDADVDEDSYENLCRAVLIGMCSTCLSPALLSIAMDNHING